MALYPPPNTANSTFNTADFIDGLNSSKLPTTLLRLNNTFSGTNTFTQLVNGTVSNTINANNSTNEYVTNYTGQPAKGTSTIFFPVFTPNQSTVSLTLNNGYANIGGDTNMTYDTNNQQLSVGAMFTNKIGLYSTSSTYSSLTTSNIGYIAQTSTPITTSITTILQKLFDTGVLFPIGVYQVSALATYANIGVDAYIQLYIGGSSSIASFAQASNNQYQTVNISYAWKNTSSNNTLTLYGASNVSANLIGGYLQIMRIA